MGNVVLKNFSVAAPIALVELIDKRRVLKGWSRNMELRYLLSLGLEYSQGQDMPLEVDLPPTRGGQYWRSMTIGIEEEVIDVVAERAKASGTKFSPEVVRLIAYALERSRKNDLETLKALLAQQGSQARPHSETEHCGSPPC